jgi:ribonuclease VapC
MIVDSSAIVAILRGEPERESYLRALAADSRPRISAATYLEAAVVIDGLNDPVLSRRFDELLDALGVEIVSVTPEQAHTARAAYRDYGRGSGHPAGLNFGDVFAYALAAETGEPLLFKGDDFIHTDLRSAG